ncbi:hypothetical protein [Hymenobacter arcticus]
MKYFFKFLAPISLQKLEMLLAKMMAGLSLVLFVIQVLEQTVAISPQNWECKLIVTLASLLATYLADKFISEIMMCCFRRAGMNC